MPTDSQYDTMEPTAGSDLDTVAELERRLEFLATSTLQNLSAELEADIFVYNGPLDRDNAAAFMECVGEAKSRDDSQSRPNAILALCTLGGDADAAYIIARHMRRMYQKFYLYVFGHCKSAGTLLALGAHELRISHHAEFGPLDVQLRKTDEFGGRNSGLDVKQALAYLQDTAYNMFTNHFFRLIFGTAGALSTKTAAEIASSLTIGLLSPITAQLDPLRIGEFDRAVNVAVEYGHRLSGGKARVDGLVSKYSSHTFVIDCEEAQEIFPNVHLLTGGDLNVQVALEIYMKKAHSRPLSLREQTENLVIGYIALPTIDTSTTEDSAKEESDDLENNPAGGETLASDSDIAAAAALSKPAQAEANGTASVAGGSTKTRDERSRGNT